MDVDLGLAMTRSSCGTVSLHRVVRSIMISPRRDFRIRLISSGSPIRPALGSPGRKSLPPDFVPSLAMAYSRPSLKVKSLVETMVGVPVTMAKA